MRTKEKNVALQAGFRQRQQARGLVQVCVWVPPAAAADFQLAAEMARANREMTPAMMRDQPSGKLVHIGKLKRPGA